MPWPMSSAVTHKAPVPGRSTGHANIGSKAHRPKQRIGQPDGARIQRHPSIATPMVQSGGIGTLNHDHEGVKGQASFNGSDDVHRQPADEVIGVFRHADLVGDEHDREEANAACQQQAVNEDDEGGLLEIEEFG